MNKLSFQMVHFRTLIVFASQFCHRTATTEVIQHKSTMFELPQPVCGGVAKLPRDQMLICSSIVTNSEHSSVSCS